jgi:antitoxin (DNA-binding transcriptional repressor) of toxin-antitoxin stability system
MGRKYVTVTNARTNFGALLDYLKATGETIYITKRGKAVVKIYPLLRSGDTQS